MQGSHEDEALPPIRIPIEGVLDLHSFRPKDLPRLIPAYLEACRMKGIYDVRLIHGKGTGTLRAGVISLLKRCELVKGYHSGNETNGSWGVTIVQLWRSVENPKSKASEGVEG